MKEEDEGMTRANGVKLTVEERNFLVRRAVQGDADWVGRSSDAMVAAAISGVPATQWPIDGWDLGRCMVTRRVAPKHLHEAMDAYIEAAKPRVMEAYYKVDSAEKMADEKTPRVAEMLAQPHWADIPDPKPKDNS